MEKAAKRYRVNILIPEFKQFPRPDPDTRKEQVRFMKLFVASYAKIYTIIETGKQQFSAGYILKDFCARDGGRKKKKEKKISILKWRSMAI